jgi:hypothetical protein
MALFADGPVSTVEDLADQDSGLLQVAVDSGINATTKIRLAHEEIATDLRLWLNKPKATMFLPWTPALHMDQIVFTPVLRRWETMHALELVYRDAYFSQLVDRYQAKWQEYIQISSDVRESFISLGLPLVNDPVHRAPAPALGSVAGPQPGGAFYASIAWVNAAGQSGQASVPSSITVADGNLMTVTPAPGPPNAVGFNVYAGGTPEVLYLQNTTALALETTFTYVPGTTSTVLAGPGQEPEFTKPMARLWLRG